MGMGVGVESGVWTVEDAERLTACGLGTRVSRILVEPGGLQLEGSKDEATRALELVDAAQAKYLELRKAVVQLRGINLLKLSDKSREEPRVVYLAALKTGKWRL